MPTNGSLKDAALFPSCFMTKLCLQVRKPRNPTAGNSSSLCLVRRAVCQAAGSP